MLTSICPTTASTCTSKLGARSQWNIAACRGRLCGGWHSTPHVAQSLRHSSYRSRGPWSSIIRGYLSSASTNFLHPLLRGRVRCPWLFARKVSSRAPLWRLSLCAACRFARQAKQPLRPLAFVSEAYGAQLYERIRRVHPIISTSFCAADATAAPQRAGSSR
jgi:hypothetical protein